MSESKTILGLIVQDHVFLCDLREGSFIVQPDEYVGHLEDMGQIASWTAIGFQMNLEWNEGIATITVASFIPSRYRTSLFKTLQEECLRLWICDEIVTSELSELEAPTKAPLFWFERQEDLSWKVSDDVTMTTYVASAPSSDPLELEQRESARAQRSKRRDYERQRKRLRRNPSLRRKRNRDMKKRRRSPAYKNQQKRYRKKMKNKPKSRRRSPRKY